MVDDVLMPHIRAVTPEDAKLPKFSYSKLEQFLNCPMAYNFKYGHGMYSSDSSLALELGSLLHGVLQFKGEMIQSGVREKIDYKLLDKLIDCGIIKDGGKIKEDLPGVDVLKDKYWEIWDAPDSEGRTYRDKIEIFRQIVRTEMEEDDDWSPYMFEMPFNFVWNDKYILHGFIDRIDKKADGSIRVLDYKTNKKVFDDSKLPTSLQFGIYDLACMVQFGQKPIENLYRFILLDATQRAMTVGWEKRLVKKLNTVFEKIEDRNTSGIWEPSPSPLCHWCSFSETNPNATEYKDACMFFSKWTPTNKSFEKNKEWNPLDTEVQTKPKKRKLVF